MLSSIWTSRRSGAKKREAGFSLIELLVTMIVLIVVLSSIYAVWSRLESTYAFTADDMLAQEQARAAMGEMVEYIRTAREPASEVAGVTVPGNLRRVIVYASPTEIQMWVDTDRDAKHTLELVRFRVEGGGLYRDRAGPNLELPWTSGTSVRLVTSNVTNNASATPPTPLFTYDAPLASLSGPVANPNLIREITIDLHIDIYTDRAPVAHELTTIVQPRNLRQY